MNQGITNQTTFVPNILITIFFFLYEHATPTHNSREVKGMNTIINQVNLICIYRVLCPTRAV